MVDFFQNLLNQEGLVVAVGVVLSFVAEYLPAYNNWNAGYKKALFFLVSLLLPIFGQFGLAALGCFHLSSAVACNVNFMTTFVGGLNDAIAVGLMVFASGTATHMLVFKKGKD